MLFEVRPTDPPVFAVVGLAARDRNGCVRGAGVESDSR
jgi:hypothetical protein